MIAIIGIAYVLIGGFVAGANDVDDTGELALYILGWPGIVAFLAGRAISGR